MYNSSGKKKTIIGSEGNGELQFNEPQGIAITGDVVYVAEYGGNRIHKLTTARRRISWYIWRERV